MITHSPQECLLQHLRTSLTCLILTFTCSWALTLVILSVVQSTSQSLATPLLASEHIETTMAATLIDCALASIAIGKAFNAAQYEQRSLVEVLNRLNRVAKED